jgi:hypothetical protein
MGQNHVKQNVKKDKKKLQKKNWPENFVLFLNKKALSSNTCQVVRRRKTIVSK